MTDRTEAVSVAEHFSRWDSPETRAAERLALDGLRSVDWAKTLLQRVTEAEAIGTRWQHRAFLWEARIAFSIHRLGYRAQYEFQATTNGKSIDFRVLSEPEILIEAVSIQNSDARQQTTWKQEVSPDVCIYGVNVTSRHTDVRATAAGEMVRVIERLSEKASKFCVPSGDVFHLLLADLRGYNTGHFDIDDCRQIALGPNAVSHPVNRQSYGADHVRGLFDPNNKAPRAVQCQERIHALGLFGRRKTESLDVLSTHVSDYLAGPLITAPRATALEKLLDEFAG